MTTDHPPIALAALAALACLALAACGTVSDAPPAPDGASLYRPDIEDFYPTGTRAGSFPPPDPPACLRTAELGFASERAFRECRRDLEVHELALDLWSRRVADAVIGESRRKHEGALAALACKLVGRDSCAPVGYGATLVSQPRPPACVGDAAPIVLDGAGVEPENCRYGVDQYRANLVEWAREVAYEARLEADARLAWAVDRFNCRLAGEPWRGAPCA
ncbi:MAG TPA: hypothetical protein VFG47_19625 [Geminicoccaceae bacterium]|nr:hypothetical protein [Geminicoccaceae bacterium]